MQREQRKRDRDRGTEIETETERVIRFSQSSNRTVVKIKKIKKKK